MMPIGFPHAVLPVLLALAAVLGLALPPGMLVTPAAAQINPSVLAIGQQRVTEFMGRMVRVTGRQVNGRAGETGYGFVIGSRAAPMPAGQMRLPGAPVGIRLLVVTADHLVRDPASADKPSGATLVFYGNLALSFKAQVLPEHLAPDQGDLAVLLTEDPIAARFSPVTMANTGTLLPGSPAWEIGRPGSWEVPPVPGQFSLRSTAGWLMFEGLNAQRGSAGGPVLSAQGLLGMVVGEAAGPAAPVRALPVELIASKLAEWGIKADLTPAADNAMSPAPGGLAALTLGGRPGATNGGMPAPDTTSPNAPGRQALLSLQRGPPPGLVTLLPNEAAARASWVPDNARVSPQQTGSAAVLSSPRRDGSRINSLPPGENLPPAIWQSGAYDISGKLDGGAWFLVATEGQPIGYVSGNDVIELWPAPTAPPAGRVVRDWAALGERHAVMRDDGSHFDLVFPVQCRRSFCNSLSAYTPRLPLPGGIVPSFQMPPIHGSWKQDEVAELHVLLPRRVVETRGTRLIACMGLGLDCDETAIISN